MTLISCKSFSREENIFFFPPKRWSSCVSLCQGINILNDFYKLIVNICCLIVNRKGCVTHLILLSHFFKDRLCFISLLKNGHQRGEGGKCVVCVFREGYCAWPEGKRSPHKAGHTGMVKSQRVFLWVQASIIGNWRSRYRLPHLAFSSCLSIWGHCLRTWDTSCLVWLLDVQSVLIGRLLWIWGFRRDLLECRFVFWVLLLLLFIL